MAQHHSSLPAQTNPNSVDVCQPAFAAQSLCRKGQPGRSMPVCCFCTLQSLSRSPWHCWRYTTGHDCPRGMVISKSRQTPTGVSAAPVTLLCPLVLQDTERPGSISVLFMSINCLAQEQFLVPVCLDCSQKHREIPSPVGWQPAITRAGACQVCQVAMAVPSKMSTSAEGDKCLKESLSKLHPAKYKTTCP